MTRSDAEQILAKIREYWPRIDWPQDIRAEFTRRLAYFSIDREQALAVLLNVRMSKPYKTCEPSDLLNPLSEVAAPKSVGGASADAEERVVREFWRARDDDFRTLCEELHDQEPRTPPHYRDAPECYLQWPVSRRWLARRIQELTCTNTSTRVECADDRDHAPAQCDEQVRGDEIRDQQGHGHFRSGVESVCQR